MNHRSTPDIPCCQTSDSRALGRHIPAAPTAVAPVSALLAVCLLLATACGTPTVQLPPEAAVDTSTGTDSSVPDSGGVDVATSLDATGEECVTDYDCRKAKGKTACGLARCTNGYCGWALKTPGSLCDDVDNLGKNTACQKARCDDAGACAMVAETVGATCQPAGGLTECERAGCNLAMECTVTIKPDETKCGDGECGQWCAKGKCTNVPNSHYEDGDPCTKDYCEQGTKILHDPITSVAACDDGNPCTGDGSCKAGKCAATGGEDCDDGLACTTDVCGKSGCEHTPSDKACVDDGGCFNMGCDLAVGCTATTVKAGATCSDGDTCTTGDACDKTGACVPTANTCKCKNDAECDQTDLCLPRYCDISAQECLIDADKKVVCAKNGAPECGKNLCDPKTGQCGVIAKNNGNVCDDGDKCTTKSACKDGDCTGDADLACDDKNPCTADSCSDGCKHNEVPGACDDGIACTVNDTCVNGGCTGEKKPCDDGVACTFDACDPKTGACTNAPKANKPCDDNNPCTADTCDVTSGCTNVADDKAACEDKDPCTLTACKSAKCVTASIDKTVPGCGCTQDKQCDDNNPCTTDTCAAGDCVFNPTPQNGKACQGGNLCIEQMTCDKGACTGGKPKACNDNNPCTKDACSAKTGTCAASPKADGTICDADGSLCTQKDTCKKGTCSAGPLKDCSAAGDVCNAASCVAKTGACSKKPRPKATPCDDGKFCTANDVCDGTGKCSAGKAMSCSTVANQCNTGICDEAKKACVKKPKAKATACDDGQYCSVGDKCDGKGGCVGGVKRVCMNNLNACKAGVCDEVANKCALKAAPAGTSCNDGNLCTQTDKCSTKGVCLGSNPKSCAGDQCNTGACDEKTGACGKKAMKNGTKCNDANLCTLTDTCQSGACKGANLKKCTGDQCNSGVCAAKTGACGKKPKNNGTTCNDGNSCTAKDVCSSGVCKAGAYSCVCKVATQAADCNDKNACTKDVCALVSGKYTCKHSLMIGAKCSDGNKCTTEDQCTKKATCSGVALVCDDKNPCTADSCSKITGVCGHKILTGFPCSDGKLCTTDDVCSNKGSCLGKMPYCNDGNGCTTDSCNPKTGKCQHLINTALCSDGNACTSGDKCYFGKCKSGKYKICTDKTKCSADSCNTKTGACIHTPVYENSTCEQGSMSLCASGSCKCRVWASLFGGSGSDYIYGVAKTSDLGTVSVGASYVTGKSYEGYLVRHDKTGKVLWAKTVPGSKSSDVLRAVSPTNKTNVFIAVGYRYLNSTYGTVGWVVFFNTSGTILSNTTINVSKSTDQLMAVIDGGGGYYYAAGTTWGVNSNYRSGWLAKINSSGYSVQNTYRKGLKYTKTGFVRSNYYFNGIARYSNYLMLAGYTNDATTSTYDYDGVVCRYTTTGSWQASYKYGGKGYDNFNAIRAYGPYFYVVGRTQNTKTKANGYDAWLLKIHYVGTKYFDRTYGSTGPDEFTAVENYGSGMIAVGSYYDPKLKRYRGLMVRGSSGGTTYGQYYYGNTYYNTHFYAVEDNFSASYYTMGGTTSQSNQAYMVRSYITGSYMCKLQIIFPGGFAKGG